MTGDMAAASLAVIVVALCIFVLGFMALRNHDDHE